jgi:protein SDA1
MDADLIVLQERCRKDPQSYRLEYLAQQNHYLALLASATLRPAEASARLPDSASFVASTAALYGDVCAAAVAGPTIALLQQSAAALAPATRRALVRTLALLRARGAADASVVIPLFFRLLSCEDKVLRRMLHGHILADVKRMQASGDKGRRSLQSFLFGMVNEPNEVLVKRSLNVLVDLFRRRIWNDARTANVIASCVFHEAAPVALIATKFLLDSESKGDDEDEGEFGEDEDDEDEPEKKAARGHDSKKASDMWKAYGLTGKKSTKKRKQMERTINRLTRVKRTPGSSADALAQQPAFVAMFLLNDAQTFAERLYSDLQTRRRNEPYENRLTFINLLTRLVGTHQLLVLNLYPFLQRYLQPAQPEVTRVLAYLAQGCHELVPPDVLHPVVRGLADNFVSERCSPPAMAAGLNTIRAICARVPLAIFDAENEEKPEDEQEAPLLEDLVQYKSNRDKGVVMAARSLISLYRDVNPRLLHKRDRGRAGAEAVQKGTAGPAPAYGRARFATGVEGVELLEESGEEDGAGGDDVEEEGEEEEGSDDVDPEDEDVDASVEEDAWGLDLDDVESDDGGSKGTPGAPGAEADESSKAADKAVRTDQLRILTDEDYKRIRARAAAKAVEGVAGKHTPVRSAGVPRVDTGEAVHPAAIQGVITKTRKNLAERMESVLAGREGREKYGSRKGLTKGGGSTNKAKLKGKSNSMVIHKQRRKSKMSRVERQKNKTKKRVYK